MTATQVTCKKMNTAHPDNQFRASESAAKRDARGEGWCVVVCCPQQRDCYYSSSVDLLYEALPPGYPLSAVVERLGSRGVEIVSRLRGGKWHRVHDYSRCCAVQWWQAKYFQLLRDSEPCCQCTGS